MTFKSYLSCFILPALLVNTVPSTQAATPVKTTLTTNSAMKKPVKLITGVTTYAERDWRSDDGKFLLTIYSGIWNPHGTLFYLNKDGGVSVEGFQKGLNITLKSYDPEIGLEAPPEYAIDGTLNLRNNTLVGTIIHYPEGEATIKKTTFSPAIPIKTCPQFVFKYYGFNNDRWYGSTITQVDVINKDTNKVVQKLTGFEAAAHSTRYVDMNYDGYFDLVLNVAEGDHSDKYIYWLYDPQSKKFVRNKTLEAVLGYATRYPHKQLARFNDDTLKRVEDQWKRVPCC
ncbi:XAC2610-related protein [Psychrobacter sp. ANT_WB68]|uniref:XAC2610-related protein n=1 Tax=Psychrobacter sp. ANT_WB68 TaxID=2597355 RepID=UPI0011F31728|nr:hypothetical protein [Psychrobacter sp. ANT_WB68]KAA0914527.1 hypothetical protein FQ084_08160 [Psychrobacter sp. ANT_WB68]